LILQICEEYRGLRSCKSAATDFLAFGIIGHADAVVEPMSYRVPHFITMLRVFIGISIVVWTMFEPAVHQLIGGKSSGCFD